MRHPFAASPEFVRLLQGSDPVDLETIAFEIAAEALPGLDPAPYVARFDELAERVRVRLRKPTDDRRTLGQVCWVLAVEEGFRGDEENYHSALNSLLPEVLDRRRGIPISLSLVYLSVARRVGLPLVGVGFPGHFMLRLAGQPHPVFVDPFDEGRVLDLPGCERRLSAVLGRKVRIGTADMTACTPHEFVARMLNNLRHIHLNEANFAEALPVVRRLAALRARDWEANRDWGVVALQAGKPGEAVKALELGASLASDSPESAQLADLLKVARRQAAALN